MPGFLDNPLFGFQRGRGSGVMRSHGRLQVMRTQLGVDYVLRGEQPTRGHSGLISSLVEKSPATRQRVHTNLQADCADQSMQLDHPAGV